MLELKINSKSEKPADSRVALMRRHLPFVLRIERTEEVNDKRRN
jgi:hypothetical protein